MITRRTAAKPQASAIVHSAPPSVTCERIVAKYQLHGHIGISARVHNTQIHYDLVVMTHTTRTNHYDDDIINLHHLMKSPIGGGGIHIQLSTNTLIMYAKRR